MHDAHIHRDFLPVFQKLHKRFCGITADSRIPRQIVAGTGGNVAEAGFLKIPDALQRFVYGAVSSQNDQMNLIFRQVGHHTRHISRLFGKVYLIGNASFVQLGFHKFPVFPAPSGAGGRIDQKMIHVFSPLLPFVNPNAFFFYLSL